MIKFAYSEGLICLGLEDGTRVSVVNTPYHSRSRYSPLKPDDKLKVVPNYVLKEDSLRMKLESTYVDDIESIISFYKEFTKLSYEDTLCVIKEILLGKNDKISIDDFLSSINLLGFYAFDR